MHASLVQQHNEVHAVTEKRERGRERRRGGGREKEREKGKEREGDILTLKDQSG